MILDDNQQREGYTKYIAMGTNNPKFRMVIHIQIGTGHECEQSGAQGPLTHSHLIVDLSQ